MIYSDFRRFLKRWRLLERSYQENEYLKNVYVAILKAFKSLDKPDQKQIYDFFYKNVEIIERKQGNTRVDYSYPISHYSIKTNGRITSKLTKATVKMFNLFKTFY